MKVEATKDAMVQAFARAIEKAGGKALLVGGLVRDEILGLPSKDYDFEVFGLPMDKVQEILSNFGNVKEVGKQFGVLNIQELDWDVALPRREKKTGEGHKGFDVVPDPTMSIEEAARRRDFTINALSKDPLTGEIIDPLNGMADIKAGILRMADPHTFGDDPLRALRGAQFAARFDMDIEPETLKVISAQPLEELPGERILPEFSKMLLKGKKPSKGIEVLRQANLLRYFPEIEALQGVPQEPEWHPEGDVYVHTMMVLDEAAKQRTGDLEFDLPLMFGALAHDFGKPMATEEIDGKITSRGHEEAGVAPANAFMQRMKAPLTLTKQVETLVSFHLRPAILPNTGGGRKGYRKLGRELDEGGVSPDLLVAMSKADVLGRTTEAALRRDVSSQDKFLEEYHQHVTSQATGPGGKLVDSVSGKHLIAKGFKPGPDMGKFLALTRSIEDETGITDPEALIDLAARFLSNRADGSSSMDKDKENQCGDSHIREGEECFDGNYRDERKKGNTKSNVLGTGKGPSGFRTDPDGDQADFLLWEQFDWMWKDGETTQHPGLANVTAEPQRRHRRHNEYPGVKDFDRGTRFSTHPLEGPLGRDGFGGSTPHVQEEAPTLPNGFTPETGILPDAESDPQAFDAIKFLDWDTPPTIGDIGPDHREPFPGSPAFPKSEYPNDKGAGYLATELPHPQLLEEALPHPSPPRSASSEENSRQSSSPGQFVSYPGGGGLDRAPMQKPRGAPQETGFMPIQNFPDPAANMFRASAKEYLPGGRADGVPSTDFDTEDLEKGSELEVWEHGINKDMAEEVAKDHLFDHPHFYDKKGKFEKEMEATASPLDSNFDQHELKLGVREELYRNDSANEQAAKELAKDNISSDPQHYSKRLKLSDIPNKEKSQDKVEPVEAFDPENVHGPGGQNPGGGDFLMDRQRSGRGGGTKIRPYWPMDFTGKKSGFMSIDLPTENIYPASVSDVEAARTMEDLSDIEAIFPKNFTTEWAPLQPNIGPTLRHRNERDVPPDPIKDAEKYGGQMEADDDANVEQKQVQPLTPNQKMGIAVDPKGPMGERIVIMFPMFEETSPAIMSLRSHRFEKHGGVVVDGPPEWLISVVPMLEALDNNSSMDGADDLFARVQQLLQTRGLTIEYEQKPRP